MVTAAVIAAGVSIALATGGQDSSAMVTPPVAVAARPAPAGSRGAAIPTYAPDAVDRELLECQAGAGAFAEFANGMAPEEAKQRLSWAPAHLLRPDAATALEALNRAFAAEFGEDLVVTSSWRSYESQHLAREAHGHLAADPGTSNHGWGIAVDLGGGIQWFESARHAWMRANAPGYGWHLPIWALEDGGLPEAWHWEFHGPTRIDVHHHGPVEITPGMSLANC